MRTPPKRRYSGRKNRNASQRIQNWGRQQGRQGGRDDQDLHGRDLSGRDSPSRNQPQQAAEQLNTYSVNTEPEIAAEYLPALFSYYPELIGRIPWVSLRGVEIPALPHRLIRSRHLFGNNNAFMKLESDDFHTIPENKARKLEFVVGSSLAKKKKKLVTFGYVGSPHCYSTVKAASQLGLKSEVVLQKAPLTTDGVEMVAAMKNLGASVKLRSSRNGLMFTAGWKWLLSRIFRSELISPGGLNGLGCLGYVSAVLELKSQIDEGLIPQPDYIFIAAGSGASLVGLEIGKRLAGLDSIQIKGIQTSDDKGVESQRLELMANNTIQILNSALKKKITFTLTAADFDLSKEYLFGGHGLCPDFISRWASQFEELEGCELDPVYTAKSLYALSDFIKKQKISEKNFLFWNTFSPFRMGDLPQPFYLKKLGFRLRSWISEEQRAGRLLDLGKI